MRLSCHRCGAELPGESVRGFCADCGAPQLIMGEMPVDAMEAAGEFAGAVPPPPRPSAIRWGAALRSGGLVAGATAVAFALGSVVPAFSLVSVLLIFGAAGLSLTLYRRAAPESWMDGPIGARIGLTTGLLLLAALTLMLAVVGMMARFRLHAMGVFDAQWALQVQVLTERAAAMGQGANGPGPAEMSKMMARPEFRAWSTLASVGLLGVLLLGLTTGSGAVVGSLGRMGRKAE